jgi:DNA polymerase-1
MMAEKPLLVLMDGHAMVYRAFYAIQQPLNVRSTGEEVRAVFGFLNTFLRSLADWRPTHCAIAFDLSKPTFRHREYDQYKAQRPPMPEELRPQFGRVRQVMQAFGVPIFEEEDYEADDLLGTLCRQAEKQEIETLILTGDTDELQLVSPWVRVLLSYSVQGRTLYDVAKVRERYGGLSPDVVPDIKALVGDPSDNIPGVPGIGAKTAIRLLNKFSSIEGIYDHLEEIGPPRAQQSLREHKEQAMRGKFLTTIVRDVPIELDLEHARFWQYDRPRVVEALTDLEFFSMVPRIPDPHGDGGPVVQAELPIAAEEHRETDYEVVDTSEALGALVRELDSTDGFAFDTETTSLNAMAAQLVGLAFSNSPNRAWYVPVGHIEGKQLPLDRVLQELRPVFESEAVPKFAHNANYDLTVLAQHGVKVNNLAFDTMLGAHLSGRKAIGLKALALERLHIEMTPISELIGTGRKQITMAQVPIDKAADYAAADADVAYQLYGLFSKEVEEMGVKNVLESVEMPLVPVLVRMQTNGVALNTSLLEQMSADLGGKISRIEAETYEVVGHQFNLNSSQQLGDVLFKELRLPHTKKTQKGYSTDASSLEGLKRQIDQGTVEDVDPKALEILDRVLEYRQLAKIKSTYVDALPSLVNPTTGRIHTSYNQTGSATGRVSSNDPNVQNIPVRTELGRQVRKAFVAENAPESTLLAADYSQIELRVLAHLSRDPGLLEAFHSGQDIHAATASSVYEVGVTGVVPAMRRVAKIMNFGVVYGLSAFGISQQTGLSPEEGKQFIETYFGKYPGIRQYIDSVKAQVNKMGYVETVMGRRRYIPETRSANFHVRAAGERMAINMPIQGTAADIVKIAMVNVQERIDSLRLRSMMTIQVHDELIFEVPKEELEQMKEVVLELMPAAMELAVPLDVELKTGYTWGDME